MSSGGLLRRAWRLVAGNKPDQESRPQRREIIRDRYDQDHTDEAAQLIAAIGGDFHSGDVAEVETADPAFWEANEFTLNYEIGAVGRAEIPDDAGQFSFTLALLAPDQKASILFIEGDQPQSAQAYLGIERSKSLAEELTLCRDDYFQGSEAEVRYDVQTDGLGTWTAFSARPEGTFWLVEGESTLVARAALTPVGTAYSDCSFYYGPSLAEAPWILRLVEIGGYPLVFQCEILPIDKVKFWRH